jgi:hypothetical protein
LVSCIVMVLSGNLGESVPLVIGTRGVVGYEVAWTRISPERTGWLLNEA